MRLRFLDIDYYEESARKAREVYSKNLLTVPNLICPPSAEEGKQTPAVEFILSVSEQEILNVNEASEVPIKNQLLSNILPLKLCPEVEQRILPEGDPLDQLIYFSPKIEDNYQAFQDCDDFVFDAPEQVFLQCMIDEIGKPVNSCDYELHAVQGLIELSPQKIEVSVLPLQELHVLNYENLQELEDELPETKVMHLSGMTCEYIEPCEVSNEELFPNFQEVISLPIQLADFLTECQEHVHIPIVIVGMCEIDCTGLLQRLLILKHCESDAALQKESTGKWPSESWLCLLNLEDDKTKDLSYGMQFQLPAIFEEDTYSSDFHVATIIDSLSIKSVALDLVAKSRFQSFESLIVVPELTLGSYLFKFMPVPTIADEKGSPVISEIIAAMNFTDKHKQHSESNWLHLDWHYSEGDSCNSQTCFNVRKNLTLQWKPFHLAEQQGHPTFEFDKSVFGFETTDPCHGKALDSEDFLEQPLVEPMFESPMIEATSDKYESLPLKGAMGNGSPLVANFVMPSNEDHVKAANDRKFVRKELAKVTICKVELSAAIHKVLKCIWTNYLTIVEMESLYSNYKVPLKFDLNAEGILILTSLVKQESAKNKEQVPKGLAALYVLWHIALNLCDYGVCVAHLCLENFLEYMRYLEVPVLTSRVELESAYNAVETCQIEDHPKLTTLEKLLIPRAGNAKILIIAERRAFFTMYKRLDALHLYPFELDREEKLLFSDPGYIYCLENSVEDALSSCTCLLVPARYITSSFPFIKFDLIIQYGTIATDHEVVENMESILQNSGCNCYILKPHMDGDLRTGLQKQKIVEANSGINAAGSEREAFLQESTVNEVAHQLFVASKPVCSKHMPQPEYVLDSCIGSSPKLHVSVQRCNLIIVINVMHLNEVGFTARRNSYQKILHFEKSGSQVIERELKLPVDLILSPQVCLILYTPDKLNLDVTSLGLENTLPLCIENMVVDRDMKAVSFAFRSCILIFEGPLAFTSLVLEKMDDIYAAGVGLNIQVQCFIVKDAETTDIIIGNCIKAVKDTAPCSMMPECETLAEIFLTCFPSVNTLTAHMITALQMPLSAFICLTDEQRVVATKEYEVPEHSLTLFKAQCDYGKACQYVTVGAERQLPCSLQTGATISENRKGFQDHMDNPIYGINSKPQAGSQIYNLSFKPQTNDCVQHGMAGSLCSKLDGYPSQVGVRNDFEINGYLAEEDNQNSHTNMEEELAYAPDKLLNNVDFMASTSSGVALSSMEHFGPEFYGKDLQRNFYNDNVSLASHSSAMDVDLEIHRREKGRHVEHFSPYKDVSWSPSYPLHDAQSKPNSVKSFLGNWLRMKRAKQWDSGKQNQEVDKSSRSSSAASAAPARRKNLSSIMWESYRHDSAKSQVASCSGEALSGSKTPIDKIAPRSLRYQKTNGKQSRLIWSDVLPVQPKRPKLEAQYTI